jgi:Glycosyl transferase family 11
LQIAPHKGNSVYILSEKVGRLGNRLFLASHVLACAIENKHTFANLAFYDYASFFKGTNQDIFCRYPIQKSFSKGKKIAEIPLYYAGYLFSSLLFILSRFGFQLKSLSTIKSSFNEGDTINLDINPLSKDISNPAQTIFFHGWLLRGSECLKKHGDEVREYFTPVDPYQSNIKILISSLKEDCDVLIGVSVRHGDYRKFAGGKYFYSIETYVKLLKQIEALFSNKSVKFFICSDEKQDIKIFEAAGLDFYFSSGHFVENLYSLAACDYTVSPPSTYGMWASFYGKTPLCVVSDPDQIISIDSFVICEG